MLMGKDKDKTEIDVYEYIFENGQLKVEKLKGFCDRCRKRINIPEHYPPIQLGGEYLGQVTGLQRNRIYLTARNDVLAIETFIKYWRGRAEKHKVILSEIQTELTILETMKGGKA